MSNDWQRVYERIQALLECDGAVLNSTVYPRWIGGTRQFWYDRRRPDGGVELCIVDAPSGARRLAFTLEEVAERIGRGLGRSIDPKALLLDAVEILPAQGVARLTALEESWQLDLRTRELARIERRTDWRWTISPDGRTALFLKDFDLWARDLSTGATRRLTSDGQADNAYGDVPMAFRPYRVAFRRGPEGCWSPDSRYFLTAQTDERHVPELPVVDHAPREGIRPTVSVWRTSLPGDPRPTEYRVLAVEVATGRQIEARYPRLPAVRMNESLFASGLAWWSRNGRTAYFVDVERGERRVNVVAFDVGTGRCRTIFSEESDTYVELGVNVYARTLIEPLPETAELVWYSERTGRGHLYLYDLESGDCRGAITAGDWQVRDVLHVDAKRREVAIRAGGLAREDPYYCRPCVASLDGTGLRVLASEPGDHVVWRSGDFSLLVLTMMTGVDMRSVSGFSPDGSCFVETVGAADRLPVSILRSRSGRKISVVESGDGSRLPSHWRWPERFTVKAADGVTDIHGLLYKPADFDPSRSYPIIDLIYGGPQLSHVPKTAFVELWPTTTLLDLASLAELGAFAVIVDGRGTAGREQKFRTASYGAIETASNLDDHVATVRALAERVPQIDPGRVGITGFSAGGYMAAMAACRYGDFFKVSVACSGNLDQSLFWLGWGERYHGPYDEALYAKQAVRTYADGLQGRLLIVHGLLDWAVHPAAPMQLVQSLVDANKDFDLLILPRAAHEIPGYGIRRRLDYFVEHLLGEKPRTDIRFSTLAERLGAKAAANEAQRAGVRVDAGRPAEPDGFPVTDADGAHRTCNREGPRDERYG